MKFKLEASDNLSKARAGELTTDHGTIQTPVFMPVGTAGSVKAVHQRELKEDINAECIIDCALLAAMKMIPIPAILFPL